MKNLLWGLLATGTLLLLFVPICVCGYILSVIEKG